ncbi:MAG: VWA domain-containing protein [Anaerolineae bacterium]
MIKTHIARLLPALVCGLVLALASPVDARAQEAAPAANGIDVVIVLDDSGSMATCWPWSGLPRHDDCRPNENPPSDPHDLRYSAARLLMQLAADDDRVAIVRFNAETQDIIGRLQPLGNRNNRQSLLAAVQPPDDYERAGGYTRIDLGLGRAVQILKSATGPARPRYVILLTDGVPTQEGPRSQDQAIQESVVELGRLGAQVFPAFLCNEKAGCPDDSFVRRTMGKVPDKARTADELLQVFSAVFARMKPDLHIVDRRNAAGDIEFTIREAHGAQQLIIVAENGGLIALKRNGNPETVSRAYQDPNILINVLEAGKLAAGVWTVATKGTGSFAVAQTATVPELIYPPPATPGSAAPHYAPTGKPVLVLARVVGPGSGEPLKMNDTTVLEPIAAGDPLRWVVLPGPGELTLQVGEDAGPLQIRRMFRVETRSDLPTALTLAPAAGATCLPEEPCPLKAGFGPGAEVTDLQAMVYVRDETQGKLIYSAAMTCTGRECVDPAEAFKRINGHTYTVRFLLQGRSNGVLFGDWTESTLVIAPAVHVRGLPPTLNLKTQPAGGWPVTVVAGATEDLGQLWATVVLTRTDDNTPVADVQVNFDARISAAGEQPATLQIALPPNLRPGTYEGLLSFATDKPTTGRKVRLPAPIPVSLNLARPIAQLAAAAVDFGTVIFDTSPNFRVNETAYLPVTFDEAPFNLKPESLTGSCPGLELVAGPPEAHGPAHRLPLTLRSAGPIAPQTCSGTFKLRGPSEDYVVSPGTPLSWRLVIPAVEWEILGVRRGGTAAPDANLGNLGKAGERAGATLLVRYTGKPPFSLQLADFDIAAEQAGIVPGKDALDLVAAPAVQQAGATDEYQVPIDVLVRRSLPHASAWARWLVGTDYGGVLKLQVAGLPASQAQEVRLRLHNPSVYQRYVQPFYRLLWPGVVTIPLSIVIPLLLLVLIWKRSKDASVERLMRRLGPQTPAPGSADASSRPAAATPSAGPPRWAALERSSRPFDGPGGRRQRIPPRHPVQPAAGKKDAAVSAAPPIRSPAPTSLPPPQRRARPARPTPPK